MDRSGAQLFEALTGAVEQRAGNFNVQDFANTAWAFAAAGRSNKLLVAALARTARWYIVE